MYIKYLIVYVCTKPLLRVFKKLLREILFLKPPLTPILCFKYSRSRYKRGRYKGGRLCVSYITKNLFTIVI